MAFEPSADFQAAAVKAKKLPAKEATNTILLKLYGLYKQTTVGDVTGDRPGMFSVEARAKWDAWSENKGKTQEDAQKAYIEYVATLPIPSDA
ncbi:acyl-CoA-binding protein [Mortierella sp. GBAus27b]|nr:hypothetical protein BGX31_011464 [Mortierella sp. GBA43]KAI8345737.1 acyl-CoA-binding protein [Mortierella sp. GBAus27b]